MTDEQQDARSEYGLMSREELREVDYMRLQVELGKVCDWLLDLTIEYPSIAAQAADMRARIKLLELYKSSVQSILRAVRDAI